MRHRGLEPRTTWLKVKCSTDWANAPWKMPRAGIEPATRGFSVLCSTNWAIWAWVAGTGFEPMTFGLWARRASRLLHPAIYYFTIKSIINLIAKPMIGLEPITCWLQISCSANWATSAYNGRWWIRTTEGVASRFTVCPLWPLGKSPILTF